MTHMHWWPILVGGHRWHMIVQMDHGGFAMDDFHTLKERVTMMRADYQQLLMDRDYRFEVGEMYQRALRDQGIEVD